MTVRILITGSRIWDDDRAIAAVLEFWRPTGGVLVHGGARGADRIAAAVWSRWRLPTERHLPDWHRFGRAAGMVRNGDMVAAGADVCLAFIRGHSRGATHCAALAEQAGITTHRIRKDA